MRPEDVPQEWVEAALSRPDWPVRYDETRIALAAVAPMIAAAEREACAEVAERAYAITDGPMPGRIASAIRARAT